MFGLYPQQEGSTVKETVLSFFVLVLVVIQSQSSAREDVTVAEAAQNAIDYYNKTNNLLEKVELVEKYYEWDWLDGAFLSARLRRWPKEMEKINQDIQELSDQARHKSRGNQAFLRRIQEVKQDVIDNYGPQDRNFRIRKNDPVATNLYASRNMKDRFDAIMVEFQDWMKSQHKFFKTHNTLIDMGVRLYPPGKDHIAIISPEDGFEDLIGRKLNKEETKLMADSQATFDDVYEMFKKNDETPLQTSLEILALENVKNGMVVDPVSSEVLQGFVPELNDKSVRLAERLLALEHQVTRIDDESQSFVAEIMAKREIFFEDLYNLQKQFDPNYEDMPENTFKDEL